MKISNIVLCLIPSVALAAESEQKQAVALPPSAHNLPSASSPELTAPSSIEDLQSDPRIYDQFGNDITPSPDYPVVAVIPSKQRVPMSVFEGQPSEPAHGSIELRSLEASSGSTKSLRARSEGTLGQTPWIEQQTIRLSVLRSKNERMSTPNNTPPYTPMPSLGHELGVMFGFIVACLLIMAVYTYFWRAADRRDKQRDKDRQRELAQRAFRYERFRVGGPREKMQRDIGAPGGAG
ncbi:hypothetical protein KXX57_006780, partial [Aspergillus fumigatus]